jgi:hypothetical protein
MGRRRKRGEGRGRWAAREEEPAQEGGRERAGRAAAFVFIFPPFLSLSKLTQIKLNPNGI